MLKVFQACRGVGVGVTGLEGGEQGRRPSPGSFVCDIDIFINIPSNVRVPS